MDWFTKLFLNEAKPALSRHAGTGTGSDDSDRTFIIEDSNGNEFVGVLVDEETIFDATENDIRLGKTAASDKGVVVGSKEIPNYHTTEGVAVVPNGGMYRIVNTEYDYSRMQGIICAFNKSINNSMAAEKVAINDNVYDVLSAAPISTVIKDGVNGAVNFGVINESGALRLIRFFMYKEEK